jgi:hypothetical protein
MKCMKLMKAMKGALTWQPPAAAGRCEEDPRPDKTWKQVSAIGGPGLACASKSRPPTPETCLCVLSVADLSHIAARRSRARQVSAFMGSMGFMAFM